jgi:hypothetical protein
MRKAEAGAQSSNPDYRLWDGLDCDAGVRTILRLLCISNVTYADSQ